MFLILNQQIFSLGEQLSSRSHLSHKIQLLYFPKIRKWCGQNLLLWDLLFRLVLTIFARVPKWGNDPSVVVRSTQKSFQRHIFSISIGSKPWSSQTFAWSFELRIRSLFYTVPNNRKAPLSLTDDLRGNVLHEVVCSRSKGTSLIFLVGWSRALNAYKNQLKRL